MLRSGCTLLLVAIIGLAATIAEAGNPANTPGNAAKPPSTPTPADPFAGLPPDVAAALQLRALQSRRHRGVQTGVPNPIIMAGPQIEPMFDPFPPTTSNGKIKVKSTYQKRLEARQLKEENKRLARERAEKKAAEKKAAKEKKAPLEKHAAKDKPPRDE